ncbi:MAG TPA: hypothetical protein VK465_18680, partial [Fibrobacteria bacterium]|nr:hypothetical protein [Fibrobacteria bacterium]
MDALRRLPALLARQRRRRSLAQAARWSVFLVVAHLLFLAMAGVSSVRQPLSEAWLQAIAWSYAIYLLLPVLLLVAWKIRSNTPEAVARELDHANPDAPDPFRTILSLGSHPESTRRELDRLLADHLPRLVFPRSASFPLLQRLLLLASVLAFAGAALVSGNFADFLYRAAAPWHALASLPILRFAVEAPPSAIGVGDTVRIRGTVVHRLPDQAIHAHVRTAAGESRYPLKLDGDRFDFAFGPVEGDFSVQFAAANGRS